MGPASPKTVEGLVEAAEEQNMDTPINVVAAERVFVYGSLMQGFGNHRLMGNSELLGPTFTAETFRMTSLGAFPGIVPQDEEDGGVPVLGELYLCDRETRDRLDELEGHPHFYRRTEVLMADGKAAWVYVLVRRGRFAAETVPHADWRAFATGEAAAC